MASTVPFVASVGFEVTAIDGDSVTVHLPDVPEVKNHVGTAHAAATFGAAETASGAVIMHALGPHLGELIAVLKNAEIKYTAPATGVLSATATPRVDPQIAIDDCLSEGRALLHVDCVLTSEDGSENSVASFTWYLKRR